MYSIVCREWKALFYREQKRDPNKKAVFWKSLVFSNMLDAETGYLIDTYTEKNIIEEDFHVLKNVVVLNM